MSDNPSKEVTLIMPYYENPGMLLKHQEWWGCYTQELRCRLHVIVVDDCSPNNPALPVFEDPGLASYRLYRLKEDIRWNWLACRNLAAKHMEKGWGLFTDIDHLLPQATLNNLVYGWHDAKMTYRLSRVDYPDLSPYKPHPNTWFMTRDRYWKVGGYDERFSGFYGTDYDFRNRVQENSKAVIMLDDVLVRVPREEIADASTVDYERKTQLDREKVMEIRTKRAAMAQWQPLHFLVDWERLK